MASTGIDAASASLAAGANIAIKISRYSQVLDKSEYNLHDIREILEARTEEAMTTKGAEGNLLTSLLQISLLFWLN